MNLFVFIADAWGPISGGINCFNCDLAIACARVKKGNTATEVCCIVPDLSAQDKKAMQEEGIIPITLSKQAFDSPEAALLLFDSIKKQRKLRHYYPENCSTFCIGHDVITGSLSKRLADTCSGWNIVFHHMDYASYYLIKNPNVDSYTNKTHLQEEVLCNADLICAVGPMLAQSAQDITRTNPNAKTIEVFPGLAEFDAFSKPANRFNPIVFGRVEKNNQSVKQIALAIDAFAKAIQLDKTTPIIGNNPTLNVMGYENDDPEDLTEEVKRLHKHAKGIAGGLCNIVPLPYTTDRKILGSRLSAASAAMMLSFHEGFGLVGYEAIAAGIPLILSKNTGLYLFLQREGLDHLVYPVDIEGSTELEGYSQNDLNTVARALRDIRQNENAYKKKALKLRSTLRSKEDKYSWKAVANRFMSNVLDQLADDQKTEATVFFCPDEVTKLNIALDEKSYDDISFDPSTGEHIFTVNGKNALASLHMCLRKKFNDKYSSYIYFVQDEAEDNSSYSDFLCDCRSFFGKEYDFKGPEFKYILGQRLSDTILILDNFPSDFDSEFNDLFSVLNKVNLDFYIFTVFETDSPPIIKSYDKRNMPKNQDAAVTPKPVPATLTDEQRLLVKVLSFRNKMGYSKKLIQYICNGINLYCEARGNSQMFENPAKTEKDLITLGFIEEFSEFSYQNSNAYLSAATELEVENESYALGISRLGRFYASCYHRNKDRDPQLSWGYFSCKCFAYAASLSDEIKKDIKADYEIILTSMRKKAMDTSDYSRYFHALQSFIDEYKEPNDLWIWYNLIHCASIYCPQMDILEKAENILKAVLLVKSNCHKKSELTVQFIRMCAELEHELDIPNSLDHLLERISKLSPDSKKGTAWAQCLSTLINIAIDQGEYGLAEEYLSDYKNLIKPNNMYPKVISTAMETNLAIARYVEGDTLGLSKALPNITDAFHIARDNLRDFRAQGWTLGLWGECQILLKDQNGEKNLQKSMVCRKSSGEKTKEYRNWLLRISKHVLQKNTRALLESEIARTGASNM